MIWQVSLETPIHTGPRRREEGYPSLVVRHEPESFFPAEYVLARSWSKDKTRGKLYHWQLGKFRSDDTSAVRVWVWQGVTWGAWHRALSLVETWSGTGTWYSEDRLDMEVSQNMTDGTQHWMGDTRSQVQPAGATGKWGIIPQTQEYWHGFRPGSAQSLSVLLCLWVWRLDWLGTNDVTLSVISVQSPVRGWGGWQVLTSDNEIQTRPTHVSCEPRVWGLMEERSQWREPVFNGHGKYCAAITDTYPAQIGTQVHCTVIRALVQSVGLMVSINPQWETTKINKKCATKSCLSWHVGRKCSLSTKKPFSLKKPCSNLADNWNMSEENDSGIWISQQNNLQLAPAFDCVIFEMANQNNLELTEQDWPITAAFVTWDSAGRGRGRLAALKSLFQWFDMVLSFK